MNSVLYLYKIERKHSFTLDTFSLSVLFFYSKEIRFSFIYFHQRNNRNKYLQSNQEEGSFYIIEMNLP